MTYNVFGGTLSLLQSTNQLVENYMDSDYVTCEMK